MFHSLFQPKGRLVEVAPWRLALVLVLQHLEGLTDRQAAGLLTAASALLAARTGARVCWLAARAESLHCLRRADADVRADARLVP
jgi:hypothetical protein